MRLWHNERGTAVVEFALVAPILLLLAFGILDFGRALNYYNHLTQLAGQGARAAVVNQNPDGTGTPANDSRCGTGNNSIQCQLARDYSTAGELRSGITVCITTSPDATKASAPGDPVTVTASYDFRFIPFIGDVLGSPTVSLSASQTERQEAMGDYAPGCVNGS